MSLLNRRNFGLSDETQRTEWSGINALLYYGPTLVRSIGFSGDTVSLLVSGGIGIVQFLAVFPAIVYIDRFGKECLTPSPFASSPRGGQAGSHS